jgi:hypothetical protein
MSTPDNEQTATPATAKKAKKKKKPKWPWIVAGFVLFLFVVGRVHSDQGKNTATSATATSSAAAAPATTTTPQGPQAPAGVQGLWFDVKPGPNGKIVTAHFKISEGFTNGLTKDGARIDTMHILKFAQAKYPNLAEVHVDASADMVDMYGRTSVKQVVTLVYSRATLDKIDWDNFDFANIWNFPIADFAEVHPAFQY